MLDCHYWVMPKHSGSRIPHYFLGFFSSFWLITVDWTFSAGSFILLEWAMIQTLLGVFKHVRAVFTKSIFQVMMVFAVELNHSLHSSFLTFYPRMLFLVVNFFFAQLSPGIYQHIHNTLGMRRSCQVLSIRHHIRHIFPRLHRSIFQRLPRKYGT